MCINLKSFNESFRDWSQKGEEEHNFVGSHRFTWFNQEEDEEPSIPLKVVSSTAVGTNFHDQRPNPQIHLDFDGDLVGIVGDPNAD